MRIVLTSSEAVPFAKTGGLADVTTALAKALARASHQVWLVLPHYPALPSMRNHSVEATDQTLEIPVGTKHVAGTILRAELPDSDVEVLLIDQPDYFSRAGLYQENGEDYIDNCARFVFLSRAVMETIRALDLQPDVIHANDWQTGLVPALLRIEYQQLPGFQETASTFTIHNMAFQGQFWHWDMELTGLDWKYFNWRQMEFFGHLNLLKTGVVFADMITAVSPTYAQEIQTPEFGCGLDGVLHTHREKLVGILNGVDTEVWNPATDRNLVQNYDVRTLRDGKAACKAALQKRLGLPQKSDIPLLAMISRMTEQKGFDLIAASAETMLELDLQVAFLGTGDEEFEQFIRELVERVPEKAAAVIGFDEALAHQMEAGADIYLMPSRFEPCGLNQMYSMAYGAVPIVHAIGGLADSVVDATAEHLAAGTANGFRFEVYRAEELLRQIRRAIELYEERSVWEQLVHAGMEHDWSWSRSAAEYVEVYRRARSQFSTVSH